MEPFNFNQRRTRLGRRVATTLGGITFAISVSGCSAYLYDAGRDQAASALAERVGDLNIASTFETERGNLNKLKSIEIATRDAHNNILWEQRLWYEAIRPHSGSPGRFRNFVRFAPDGGGNLISQRSRGLGVYSQLDLNAAHRAWNENRPQAVIAGKPATERVLRLCKEGTATGRLCPENGPTLDGYCDVHIKGLEKSAREPSELAAGCKSWRDERKELTEARKRRTQVLAELQSNKPDSEDDNGAKEASFDLKGIQKGAENAANILAAAGKLSESLGTDAALANEQAAALETLLTAFASGEAPSGSDVLADQTLQRAAVIVAGLPGLAKDARTLLDTMNEPDVRALAAFELDRLRIEAAYLKDRIALLQRRVAERRAGLMASLREVHLLRAAKFHSENALPSLGGSLVATIIAGGSRSAEHVSAMRALIALDHSQTVARRDQDRALFNVIDLDHRQALLADEYTARQWDTLIRPAVKRLADYHASGVRAEVIADLILKAVIAAQL